MLDKKLNAKIIGCSDFMLWYRDMIGELIFIEREDTDYYWSREKNHFNCLNILHKSDVELLHQQTMKGTINDQ
jgi:replication initiation and membrane attachment protein DnaB